MLTRLSECQDLIKSTPSSWLRPGHPWLEPDGFWYRQEASRVWASAPDAASRRFDNNNGATTFWDFPLTVGWSNCSAWRSSQRCPAQRLAQAANGAFSSAVFTYVTPCRNSTLPPAAAPADDVSAILGNMAAGADAPFVRNMQDLFYGFVRDGILQPGAVRASAGVYVVSDGAPIRIRSGEPTADCPQSASTAAAAADPVSKK